jgi:hypothetical protein
MKTIPLTQGKVALVDDADFGYLNQWSWQAQKCVNKCGEIWYAYRSDHSSGKKHCILMHRELIDCPIVDHRDLDGLNNQRSNLRPCTKSQNAANSRKQLGSVSRYKGVHWDRDNEKWRTQILVNRQKHHLGRFDDETIAGLVYDIAALAYFGEFAKTNFQIEAYLSPQKSDGRLPKA